MAAPISNPYPTQDIGSPWTTQQLLDFLVQQGIIPQSPSGQLTKAQLKSLADAYAKSQTPTFAESEFSDTITPKYLDNAKMIDAFTSVESGFVPEEVIDSFLSKGESFSPTEEQDLKDYYANRKKRIESQAERAFGLEGISKEYGLAPSMEQFDIPMDVVLKNFRTMPGQDTPISTLARQDAMRLYNDLREVGALRDRMVPASKQTTNFGFSDDPASFLFNKTFGNLLGVGKVSKNVETMAPAPLSAGQDAARKRYEALKAIADAEAQKDIEARDRLVGMLNAAYGSPLEKQIADLAFAGALGSGGGDGSSSSTRSKSRSDSSERRDTEPVPHTDRYSDWAIKNWSSLLYRV